VLPTRPQVEQLAPDAASLTAARSVSRASSWRDVATGEQAVWGICAGSREYRVQVDLDDLATRCSCPSRKVPCKHALGLLLMAASSPPPAAPTPPWAADWLATRRDTQARAAARATADPDATLSPDELAAREAKRARARDKRQAQREARVGEGLAALDLWMRDLVRAGIGELDSRPHAFWSARAQALGDAQAPGLRRRVAALGEVPGSGPDWPSRALGALGQLALLVDAWTRQESLPPPLREDLRTAVGFGRRAEAAMAHGDHVDDTWVVAGQRVEEGELTWSERTWLLGVETGRAALSLRFAPNPGAFGPALLPATCFRGRLAFHPSALPLRAVLVDREEHGPADALPTAALHATVDAFLDAAAARLAAVPWADLLPCALRGVIPLRDAEASWWIRDGDGRGMRLQGTEHWTLLALSGGRPLDVFGEWDGHRLRPLLAAGALGLRPLWGEAL
jgi:hypothetical protein